MPTRERARAGALAACIYVLLSIGAPVAASGFGGAIGPWPSSPDRGNEPVDLGASRREAIRAEKLRHGNRLRDLSFEKAAAWNEYRKQVIRCDGDRECVKAAREEYEARRAEIDIDRIDAGTEHLRRLNEIQKHWDEVALAARRGPAEAVEAPESAPADLAGVASQESSGTLRPLDRVPWLSDWNRMADTWDAVNRERDRAELERAPDRVP